MVDALPEDEHDDETSAASDRFGLVGLVLEGKYRIDRVVAEGGFAVVYQGTHLRLGQPVAVKVLKFAGELDADGAQGFVARFAEEARTLAGLQHPAIVKAIDFGAAEVAGGVVVPWMVLEWIEGVTLDRHFRTRRGRGGRRPSEVLALLRPALEALSDAHDVGVAHRDLKPANMMLLPGRRGPRVKLLDFGIAKRMGEDEAAGSGATRTASTLQAFSPRYAAPEQCGSTRTGPWTDVHAMGLILVEALTDRAPYRGSSLGERLAAALSPERPLPSRRGVDVGPWEAVLARALALNPAERFANAGAFLEALEATEAQADLAWGARPAQGVAGLGAEASQPISREDTTLSGSAVVSQVPPPVASVPPPRSLAARLRTQRQALYTLAGAAATIALSLGVMQFVPASRPAARPVVSAPAPVSPRVTAVEAPVPAAPVPAAPVPAAVDGGSPVVAPVPVPTAPASAPTPEARPAVDSPSSEREGRSHRGHAGHRRDGARARRVHAHTP